jgi:hypothetical protein
VILFLTSAEDDGYATVRFPYDPEAVEIIKSAPVHRWSPRDKQWTTETAWVELLAKRFHDQGYDVAVDGELWAPPDPAALVDPLRALFEALPPRLRPAAFKALSKILHPDTGGDNAWMRQLIEANNKTR